MLDQLAYMLGGRAAEELVFHDPTTGAANDIEKATATARAMVTQYGMTERLGAIKFGGDNTEPFLGREMGTSATTRKRSPRSSTKRSRSSSRPRTTRPGRSWSRTATSSTPWCSQLLEKETLSKEQIAEVFAPIVKRPARPAWTGSSRRTPSTRPPVLSPKELSLTNGANGSAPAITAKAGATESVPATEPVAGGPHRELIPALLRPVRSPGPEWMPRPPGSSLGGAAFRYVRTCDAWSTRVTGTGTRHR